jgi:hypothetical protein
MNRASIRSGEKRARSHEMMRPFRTAIRTLGAACLLLGIVAVLHEASPSARLVAERATDNPHIGLSNPTAATDPTDIFGAETLPAFTTNRLPSDLSSLALPGIVSPKSADGPIARAGKDSAHFWNAAQTAPEPDRGPIVQIGPPLVDSDSPKAVRPHASVGELSSSAAPLLTRTYRPTSMSAVSLERLVRPLLTARGGAVAATAGSSLPNDRLTAAGASRSTADAESADGPGVLIVSDRPDAIGRIDALCHDLESMSPSIAIDLVVVSVLPAASRHVPWDRWRNSFGIVEADLPSVLNQIRGLGRATVRASSQLQGISGSWTELEWREQSVAPGSSRPASDSAERETGPVTSMPISSTPAATLITTLRVRPSSQSDGAIRIEVRAQSSRLEDHAHGERDQVVTVRFNTEVLLREGATGVINLFVDEPSNTGSAPAGPMDPAAAALVIPGGLIIPAAKIVPQPEQREQTLLLLMPRIAGPPRPTGKVAASKTHNPA